MTTAIRTMATPLDIGGGGSTLTAPGAVSVTAALHTAAPEGMVAVLVNGRVAPFEVTAPGAEFTQASLIESVGNRYYCFVAEGPMTAGTPVTVGITTGVPNYFQFRVVALPGMTRVLDQATFSGTAGLAAVGAITAGEPALVLAHGGGGSGAWASPFVAIGAVQAGNGVGNSWAGYAALEGGGTVTAAYEWQFASNWALQLVAFAPQEIPEPPIQPPVTGQKVRRYDLTFYRRYGYPEVEPPEPPEPPGPPRPPGEPVLVWIRWDGLELQDFGDPSDPAAWFTAVVTLVDGWYASPPLDGNNAERALSDGQVRGRKLLGARVITIDGAAVGPRDRLMGWRDLLAARAGDRLPRLLEIRDPWLNVTMTAMVRADTELFRHEFFAGPVAFRYSVTVIAADPLLYGQAWHVVVLTTETAADAGRRYEPQPPWPRRYDHPPGWAQERGVTSGWGYESPYPPGSAAFLQNRGNAAAPVFATYQGDLSASVLTDGFEEQEVTGQILLEPVPGGVTINVATATLIAEAPGGSPRAQWVRPGSRPLVIPGFTTVRWHLYATGSGRVTLTWRDAWI
jgi:hypothetical protein